MSLYVRTYLLDHEIKNEYDIQYILSELSVWMKYIFLSIEKKCYNNNKKKW